MGVAESNCLAKTKKDEEPSKIDDALSDDSDSDESWVDETSLGMTHSITVARASNGSVGLSIEKKPRRMCSDNLSCQELRQRNCSSFFSSGKQKSRRSESAEEDDKLDELQKLLGQGGDDKAICCPAGHPLLEFEVGLSKYDCSVCDKTLPRGSMRYACDPCKFNLCSQCAGKWKASQNADAKSESEPDVNPDELEHLVREETEAERLADWADAYNQLTPRQYSTPRSSMTGHHQEAVDLPVSERTLASLQERIEEAERSAFNAEPKDAATSSNVETSTPSGNTLCSTIASLDQPWEHSSDHPQPSETLSSEVSVIPNNASPDVPEGQRSSNCSVASALVAAAYTAASTDERCTRGVEPASTSQAIGGQHEPGKSKNDEVIDGVWKYQTSDGTWAERVIDGEWISSRDGGQKAELMAKTAKTAWLEIDGEVHQGYLLPDGKLHWRTGADSESAIWIRVSEEPEKAE